MYEGLLMIDRFEGTSWARRVKVRHLESFLVLDEAGTLTAAAARLHMTQSAMSHWLAELESVVDTVLVVRGRTSQGSLTRCCLTIKWPLSLATAASIGRAAKHWASPTCSTKSG